MGYGKWFVVINPSHLQKNDVIPYIISFKLWFMLDNARNRTLLD